MAQAIPLAREIVGSCPWNGRTVFEKGDEKNEKSRLFDFRASDGTVIALRLFGILHV